MNLSPAAACRNTNMPAGQADCFAGICCIRSVHPLRNPRVLMCTAAHLIHDYRTFFDRLRELTLEILTPGAAKCLTASPVKMQTNRRLKFKTARENVWFVRLLNAQFSNGSSIF